jgi:hypothetical protein
MGLQLKIGLMVVLVIILGIVGKRLVNYSELKKEKKKLEAEAEKFDQKVFKIKQAKLNDSLQFVNRVSDLQKTIAQISLNEKTAVNNLKKCEYEKEQILRGELCEETYGLFKKKRRLVPCGK